MSLSFIASRVHPGKVKFLSVNLCNNLIFIDYLIFWAISINNSIATQSSSPALMKKLGCSVTSIFYLHVIRELFLKGSLFLLNKSPHKFISNTNLLSKFMSIRHLSPVPLHLCLITNSK